MDTLKLDMAVGLLTRESKHRMGDTWVTALPLLVQLQMAVGNSAAPALFKVSGGTPLPLSADAHDLMSQIRETTIDHWWQIPAKYRTDTSRSSMTGRLRAWAGAARNGDADLAEAERITTGWVADIEALFEPRRTMEIKGRCPACGVARVVDRVDDGQTFMKPALALVYARGGDRELEGMECFNCRASWDPVEAQLAAHFVLDPEPTGGDAA